MTTRDQQKRLIARLRAGLISTSVLGALGLAGYLGVSTQASAAEPADTGSTGTTDSTGSTDRTDRTDRDGSTTYFGDAPQISSGSGSSHARTSGS